MTTSKEALERLKVDIEINYLSTKHNNEKDKSNYLILLNSIEKDLEILEIIKKWSFIQESYKEGYGPYTKFQCIIHTIGMEEDFKKVKEWLEE